MHGRTLVLAALLIFAAPATAGAVTCAGLQTELTNAAEGDTVSIDQGVTCTGNYVVPAGKTLTIEGTGTGAILDPTGAGRALTWHDAGNAVIRNLGIYDGGVAFTGESTPSFDNVGFNSGEATNGGALSISGPTAGSISLHDVDITQSTATQRGGGLYLSAPNVDVNFDGVTFGQNTAGMMGGGAYVLARNITLYASTVLRNHVLADTSSLGGGAFLEAGGQLTVDHNIFQENDVATGPPTGQAQGGGLYASASGAVVTFNLFDGNEILAPPGPTGVWAAAGGGGAWIQGDGTASSANRFVRNTMPATPGLTTAGGAGLVLSADSSTAMTSRNDSFLANTAAGDALGAGLYLPTAGAVTLQADHLTIAGNSAAGGASGLFAAADNTVTLGNAIVYGNAGAPQFGAVTPSATFSDICDGAAAWPGTGNICADPLLTNVATGNGRPLSGSPVIDRGSNALTAGLTTDVLGFERVTDGDADAGCTAVVDMGAAERPAASCTPVTPPPAPTPAPPAPTPDPPAAPPVTDPGQVLLCEGRRVVLIDIRRAGRFQVLRGLSLVSLAGKRVTIRGDHGAGTFRAKIAADGTFTARVPNPRSDQTSYVASIGADRSIPLKVSRHLTVVSQRKVAGGVRIVARHTRGRRVTGERATLLRQTGCGVQSRGGTAKFDRRGRVTFVLALPVPPDTVAVYRVTTRTNRTYTLPVVVRR